MLKESKYLTFVEKENIVICYNSFNDTFIAISRIAFDNYKKTKDYEMLKSLYPNLYNTFIENEFLIPIERDELAYLRNFNKLLAYQSRDYIITILPTLDCNLKCWYCFESHIENSIMSKSTMDSIVKHIKKLYERNEIENVMLDWFGGEPLIDFDNVAYSLSKEIKEIVEAKGYNFQTFFTTNAVLITDEMIPKFAEINANFQITLDGNKEKHDKVRYTKNNQEGTYTRIINSIYKITNNIDKVFVNIRINYDNATLKNIEEIVSDLIDLDRAKVRIHLERVWQTHQKLDGAINYLGKAIELLTINKFEVSYINFGLRPFACKAEKFRQASILYDGRVFKCSGRDFTKFPHDGILKENGEIQWNNDLVNMRIGKATFENEMCLNCKILPMCMGPCSQKIIDKEGVNLHKVCTLNTLEMSLNDYIAFRYNNLHTMNTSYNH